MEIHRPKSYFARNLIIVILIVVLGLAWREVWKRGDKIRSLEAQIEILTGEISDLQAGGDL